MSMLKVYRAFSRTCTLKVAASSLRRLSTASKFKKPAVITLKPMTSTIALRKMSGTTESMSKGSGGVPGSIPDILSQGAGIEHEELSMLVNDGNVRFDRRPLVGPFGTVAAPVAVPSGLASRVVACTGGGPDQPEHPQLWFNVKKGILNACPQCGQIFKLVPPADVKASDNHSEDH